MMILDTNKEDYEILSPKADAMIHSLRAFGYDITTAIADLVDNSIAAESKNIHIDFNWNGEKSSITILDDGKGMNKDELITAMLLGSKSPLIVRDPKDLGRFGLGLKTASFSQCKRLTVKTKKIDDQSNIRCWDLDYVTQSREWRLLCTPFIDTLSLISKFDKYAQGTIVVWENLDRIIGECAEENVKVRQNFWNLANAVKNHVSMTFHRFLEGKNKLNIYINDRLIKPWDPFLTDSKACQILPEEYIQLKDNIIRVTPYVLPHHSKISQEVFGAAAGIKGWTAQQGFYIYRNRRLIVSGDWLGLPFKKEEHYKLARIQVDIPNNMDEEWDIDVKKSKAKVPYQIREEFLRIAKLTRERASNIYRHRGKLIARQNAADYVYVWGQKVKHGKVSYEINRENPIVKEALSLDQGLINALLKTIEETIPIETIVYKKSEEPDNQSIPFSGQIDDLKKILLINYRVLSKSGLTFNEIKRRLLVMEPFNAYQEILEACLEEIKGDADE